MYISPDLGHKKFDENGNMDLEGQKTEISNIFITDIGNHRSLEPPHSHKHLNIYAHTIKPLRVLLDK